jgi:hypothetical protein
MKQLLVVITIGLSCCASPLSLVVTVTPTVLDLTESDGRYPLAFDIALTNRSHEEIELAAVLEYALRVEYLRREGKLVAPSRDGPKYCCDGTDRDLPCECELPKRLLLPAGRTWKHAQKSLVFTYCDRSHTVSEAEYRPRPGRYTMRFSYRAHGVAALSNEVTFEIRGR